MEMIYSLESLVQTAAKGDPHHSTAALNQLSMMETNSLRYELAANNLPDVVFYETGGGREYVSDSLASILGYPLSRFTDDREFFVSLMHTEEQKEIGKRISDWHESGETEMLVLEFRAKHADGSWIWFEDRMVHIKPADSNPYMFGVLVNMTRRKNAELALIEAETKIAGSKALQATARTFAHHINNPLTGILGNCQILREELDDREELQEIIGEIKTCARKIGEVTQKLLSDSDVKYKKYLEGSDIIDV